MGPCSFLPDAVRVVASCPGCRLPDHEREEHSPGFFECQEFETLKAGLELCGNGAFSQAAATETIGLRGRLACCTNRSPDRGGARRGRARLPSQQLIGQRLLSIRPPSKMAPDHSASTISLAISERNVFDTRHRSAERTISTPCFARPGRRLCGRSVASAASSSAVASSSNAHRACSSRFSSASSSSRQSSFMMSPKTYAR